jgi:hypothetical protein
MECERVRWQRVAKQLLFPESWRTNQEPHRHRHEYTSLILSIKPYPIIFVRPKAASPWKGIESVFVIPTVVESLLMLHLSWFQKGTNSSTASSTIVFIEFFHWRGKYTIGTITIVGTCKSRLSWWVMGDGPEAAKKMAVSANRRLSPPHKAQTTYPCSPPACWIRDCRGLPTCNEWRSFALWRHCLGWKWRDIEIFRKLL